MKTKRGIGIFVSLIVLIFGGSIIGALIYNTGVTFLMVFSAMAVFWLTLNGVISFVEKGKVSPKFFVGSFLFLTAFIFSSFAVLLSRNEYAILERGNEVILINGDSIFIPFTFRPPVQYLGNETLQTRIYLAADGHKEVVWDLVAKLKTIEDYPTIFSALARFGSKDALMAKIEEMVQETTKEYILSNFRDMRFPKEFRLVPDTIQQRTKFFPLGYEIEEIIVKNVRLIRTSSS